MKRSFKLIALILSLCLFLSACVAASPETAPHSDSARETYVTAEKVPSQKKTEEALSPETEKTPSKGWKKEDLPAYTSSPWVVLNQNVPYFTKDEIKKESFEFYSELDALGRCGEVVACIGKDIMPTEDRGSIGQVKPSGWQTVKYDFVDGKYLYNRCHLIGFQLTGENANTRNLITGTRYLNIEGMLPFENMVADFVKETGYHVMYRVTPVFMGNDLLAKGVVMEAISVEDEGEGISFCVWCFNVQPGVTLDYATGASSAASQPPASSTTKTTSTTKAQSSATYVLNTDSKKIHYPSCAWAKKIAEKNYATSTLSLSALQSQGYTTCGHCF